MRPGDKIVTPLGDRRPFPVNGIRKEGCWTNNSTVFSLPTITPLPKVESLASASYSLFLTSASGTPFSSLKACDASEDCSTCRSYDINHEQELESRTKGSRIKRNPCPSLSPNLILWCLEWHHRQWTVSHDSALLSCAPFARSGWFDNNGCGTQYENRNTFTYVHISHYVISCSCNGNTPNEKMLTNGW